MFYMLHKPSFSWISQQAVWGWRWFIWAVCKVMVNCWPKDLGAIMNTFHLSVWCDGKPPAKTKTCKKKQKAEQKCCLRLQTLVYLFQDIKLSSSCALHPAALFPLASAEPAASPGGRVHPCSLSSASRAGGGQLSWLRRTHSESCRTETHYSPPTSVLVRQRQPETIRACTVCGYV